MPEIIAGLCILSALWFAWLVLGERRRRRTFQGRMQAKWRILVEGTDDATTVYIFRDVDSHVMDRTVVKRIPKNDPAWRDKVQDAQIEARARIDTLEAAP